MLQILIYSILTLVILFFLGFGLTQLIIPKQLRTYSLWLSPWFTIIFIIITSVIFGLLGLSIKYIASLIIIVLVLINLIVLLKTKLRYVFFLKEDGIIVLFVILNIIFNLSPLIIRDKFPTTISFGNNDIINYTVASDDLMNNSLYKIFITPLSPADKSHALIRGGYRWGPELLTVFFQYIFNLQAYQYIYILQVILFTLSVPLLYLLCKVIYKPTIFGLIVILLTMGFNANLLYMLYNNFFGQVLFWGLELFSLFFLFAYFSLYKEEKKFNKYELIIGITLAALYFSYHEGLIFIVLPLVIFLFLRLILKKNISAYCFALTRIFLTLFLVSSYSIFNAVIADYIQSFGADRNQPIGWQLFRNELPYANPFEMMGLYSIHSFKPLPVVVAIFFSLLTIIIIGFGFQKSKGKLLAICFLTLHIILLSWLGLLDHNFFAYNRVLTYILPFFLMLFSIGVTGFYDKYKRFTTIVLVIIIGLEMLSGIKLNKRFIKGRLSVDKSYVSIKELDRLNIKEPIYSEIVINPNLPIWEQIWSENFLYNKNRFQPEAYQKVQDNNLVLIAKTKPWLMSRPVFLKNIIWENEYYKLGRLCNSQECLMGRQEDLSIINVGRNGYEDSLLIDGWSVKEPESRWAVGKESTLRLVAKKEGYTKLVIEALALKEPQELSVYIDDQFVGKQDVKAIWQTYEFKLRNIKTGVYNIKFVYANIYKPVDLGISQDARELAVNIRKIEIK